MGTFPTTDAEIILPATEMVSGLQINAAVSLSAFQTAIQTSLTAHAAAETATENKLATENVLTKSIKKIVGYAETAVGNDEAKLQRPWLHPGRRGKLLLR